MTSSTPPSHARPSHHLITPRLILRSGHPHAATDARPFSLVRSDPLNNPFGGVVNATLPEDEQRRLIEGQAISTAEGKNAFLNIILKRSSSFPSPSIPYTPSLDALSVTDGLLIGMSGFNCFPTSPSGDLIGDTGVLIDHRFARKGFAMEALEAVIEYGFNELGCGKMSLETNAVNEPFRALMRGMALGDVEEKGTGGGEEESVVYVFGRERWEVAKSALKERGKWYLE
ncbi:hypothetical protein EG329_003323 [Mollisiaceae sp. DMI_Dod_QoI]|nr:hypothetical protein EG329_003323 [Helotiales sp. DMI_Dod_QoI]